MGLSALILILLFSAEGAAAEKRDMVLYAREGLYCAFPSLYKGEGDELWVTFGWNTTRSHYGRAAGGETGSVALYSPDGGKTWLEKRKDAAFKNLPDELRSMRLSDGTLIRLGARMHEILPKEKKQELVERGIVVKDWGAHISASYRVAGWRRKAGERAFRKFYPEIPQVAQINGYGWGIVTPSDIILKPLYGLRRADDPAYRMWVLRSEDGGEKWELITVAYDGVHPFGEADIIRTRDGEIIAMIRTYSGVKPASMTLMQRWESGFLWQSVSEDEGKTWSKPRRTPIWGHPPHLTMLRDGTLLCTYGYRRPPYGIRACFSYDGGKTWDVENEVILRWDGFAEAIGRGEGNIGDLGYPKSVELSDGSIFTVYYITVRDRLTHIAATHWTRDYRGAAEFPRGESAVPPPNFNLPPHCIPKKRGRIRLGYAVMQGFVPIARQIKAVAIRVDEKSASEALVHTNGLFAVIRKPSDKTWWTNPLGKSRLLKPSEIKIGGWNLFVFDEPMEVKPREFYVLTIYNADYAQVGRLRKGLTGDHTWFLNYDRSGYDSYPNGGIAPDRTEDIAFKVYSELGRLPED